MASPDESKPFQDDSTSDGPVEQETGASLPVPQKEQFPVTKRPRLDSGTRAVEEVSDRSIRLGPPNASSSSSTSGLVPLPPPLSIPFTSVQDESLFLSSEKSTDTELPASILQLIASLPSPNRQTTSDASTEEPPPTTQSRSVITRRYTDDSFILNTPDQSLDAGPDKARFESLISAIAVDQRQEDIGLHDTISDIIQRTKSYGIDVVLLKDISIWLENIVRFLDNRPGLRRSIFWEYRPLWEQVATMLLTIYYAQSAASDFSTTTALTAITTLSRSHLLLTQQMLGVDLRQLEVKDVVEKTTFSAVCARHLEAINCLVAERQTWLCKAIGRSRHWEFIAHLATGTTMIADLVALHAKLLEGPCHDTEPFTLSLSLLALNSLVLNSVSSAYLSGLPETQPGISQQVMAKQLMRLFHQNDGRLRQYLKSRVDPLHRNYRQMIQSTIESMLLLAYDLDASVCDTLILSLPIDIPSGGAVKSSSFLSIAWQTSIIKQYICDGTVPLRVCGTDLMASIVTDLFNHYYQGDTVPARIHHSLTDFAARIIIHEDIINHWIQIVTMPQLVGRLSTVISFLIATDRLSPDTADALWKQLLTHADQSTRPAFLDAILGVLHLLDAHQVLGLCSCVANFPPVLSRAGPVPLYENLLIRIMKNTPGLSVDTESQFQTMTFCMDVICRVAMHCNAQTEDTTLGRALVTLESFAAQSCTEARIRICTTWCKRLQQESGGGIMLALFTMLRCCHADCDLLCATTDFSQSVFKVFQLQIAKRAFGNTTGASSLSTMAMWLKLPLLLFIMSLLSTSEQDCTQFWSYSTGEHALDEASRDLAWRIMHKLIAQLNISQRTTAYDALCKRYIPLLREHDLVLHYVTFMQKVLSHNVKCGNQTNFLRSDDLLTAPVLSNIWNVLMCSPYLPAAQAAQNHLAELFTDRELLSKITDRPVEAIHKRLVRTCMDQCDLSNSREAHICRVIEFLTDLQSRLYCDPQFTQAIADGDFKKSAPITSAPLTSAKMTEQILIPYALSAAKRSPRNDVLVIEALATRRDLHTRIVAEFELLDFKTILQGQVIDLLSNPLQTLADMEIATKGRLIVVESRSPTVICQDMVNLTPTVFEKELNSRFTQIYDLLGNNEELGAAVFKLLASLRPSHHLSFLLDLDIRTSVGRGYPLEHVYQTLYSIHCLKTGLIQEKRRPSADRVHEAVISHLQQLLHALPLPDLSSDISSTQAIWRDSLLVLKQAFDLETAADHVAIERPASLAEKLLQSLSIFCSAEEFQATTCDAYSVLMALAVRSREAWTVLSCYDGREELHSRLFLRHAHPGIRIVILNTITAVSRSVDHDRGPDFQEFIDYNWDLWSSLITESFSHAESAVEFYGLLGELFRLRFLSGNSQPDDVRNVRTQCLDWIRQLLSYRLDEESRLVASNNAFCGLIALTNACFDILDENTAMSAVQLQKIGRDIWSILLFPSSHGNTHSPAKRRPVLHSHTRRKITALFCTVMRKGGLGLRKSAGSWLTQVYENDENLHWQIDSDQIMRPACGYMGLRNLGNTCYINSLLTQLFMCPRFRQFMLTQAPQSGASGILETTRNLFSRLEYSLEPYGDPEHLVKQLRTYTGDTINVNEQMDVEEFFNLVFEQWEEQMASRSIKQEFRSIFGAEIMYQTRSLECEHISERTEPCFNIQCDVQDKADLEESLRAYVEGDAMKGDNKYKCESCGGKLVDAVRRTCLKEVPDNLILHLKRFEYDINSQQRKKINARFAFPETLNVTPYKLEQLSRPEITLEADLFELVGVLVHRGQAEYGHYISYIRTSSAQQGTGPSWLLFDDCDVSPFDPKNIASMCFGGYEDSKGGVDPMAPSYKAHSAYMLFYRRTSSIDVEPCSTRLSEATIPPRLKERLQGRNEQIMLTSCLFSDAHDDLLNNIARQLDEMAHSDEEHDAITTVVASVWVTIVQVSTRKKDASQLKSLLDHFLRLMASCERCTKLVLSFLWDDVERFREILTETPVGSAREAVRSFVAVALRTIHDRIQASRAAEHPEGTKGAMTLESSLSTMRKMLVTLGMFSRSHLHHNVKGWTEFWELILTIAQFSPTQCRMLIESEFLLLCLEQLCLEWSGSKGSAPAYVALANMLSKRSPSSNNLILALFTLLQHVALEDIAPDSAVKSVEEGTPRLPLSASEALVLQRGTNDGLVWLARVFEQWNASESGRVSAPRLITELLLQTCRSTVLEQKIHRTILAGLTNYNALVGETFITAIPACLEYCSNEQAATELFQSVGKVSRASEQYPKMVILKLWTELSAVQSKNTNAADSMSALYRDQVLKHIPPIVPYLLMPPIGSDTKLRTMALLHELLFEHQYRGGDEEDAPTTLELSRFDAVRNVGQECVQEAAMLLYRDPPVPKWVISPLIECARACAEHIEHLLEVRASNSLTHTAEDEVPGLDFRTILIDILPAFEAQPEVVDDDLESGSSDTELSNADDDEIVMAVTY